MNALQGSSVGDVSLDGIAVMASAIGEKDTQCAYRSENETEVMGQTVKVCVSGGKGNVTCC